jgi:hypothetical protein
MTKIADAEALPAPPAPKQQGTRKHIYPPPPVVQLDTEPPARIFVEQPVPAALELGRGVSQYRAEHLRIRPV